LIFLIAGPTASGKSALALRVAEQAGGEIVNADALQLYRDLRVLSARPSPEDEARTPHHLFGVADAADGWSVGRWLAAAGVVIEAIEARSRPAIVVGGTGLYFRALTKGLADIPAVPQKVREDVRRAFEVGGETALRARLAQADPQAAARIAAGDVQRLLRALGVAEATGRSLSAWQAGTTPFLAADRWRGVVLEPPRDALYAHCDARFEAMVEQGAAAEARALIGRALDPALPAMKAVGLRELAAYLGGETTLPAALAEAQMQTRRYAKRQLTWFRHQTPDWPRVAAADAQQQWRQWLALNPDLTLPSAHAI
jgi:tRNA dimethylallyltransferase